MEKLEIDYEAGLIEVRFKNTFSGMYEGQSYAYLPYKNVSIGDIVVVNTKKGEAIAKVVKKDVYDCEFDYEKLSTVKAVIEKGKDPKKIHLEKMAKLKEEKELTSETLNILRNLYNDKTITDLVDSLVDEMAKNIKIDF